MRKEVIGDATLYLGDCLDILPGIGFDALICDPPYGMDYQSNHNTARKGAGAEMVRKDGDFKPIRGDKVPFDPSHLLRSNVPTILWGGNYYSDKLPAGRKWLIWDKLAGKTPVPSGSDIELAWTSEEGPSRMFTHLWRGIMRAGEENVTLGPKLHPNQKPVALMRWCLGQIKFKGSRVADGYMGSASLGVACIEAGLEYIGVELDPEHFETACRRIEQAYKQRPLFAAEPVAQPEQLGFEA